MLEQSWEVYMIQTASGKFYTGITTDLDRRFAEHQQNKKGAKFFRFSHAGSIVFRETYPNRSEATKRELHIKKMSRKEKIHLIQMQQASELHSGGTFSAS